MKKDSFKIFKEKTKRNNQKEFEITWYFASIFSKYFSYIFYRIGLNANQVTILFFLVGFLGASIIFLNTSYYLILSYLLFRLHLIFDLSDGDIARYNKSFSVKGAYMDYMIHSILYPLYIINLSIICYINYLDVKFLFLGLVLSFLQSLLQATKNTFQRAFHQSSISNKSITNVFSKGQSSIKKYIINILTDLLSVQGFVFGFVILYLINIEYLFIPFFTVYIFILITILIIKTYLQLNNKVYKKN
tara:strand:+ start:15613 stop:16350 length:738 start_codon:yes stop_codon:yes gene_type:complete